MDERYYGTFPCRSENSMLMSSINTPPSGNDSTKCVIREHFSFHFSMEIHYNIHLHALGVLNVCEYVLVCCNCLNTNMFVIKCCK